jgi:hypothetical protein
MPVLFLIRKVLGVDANRLRTFITGIGKDVFVAFNAIGMIVPENVSLSR